MSNLDRIRVLADHISAFVDDPPLGTGTRTVILLGVALESLGDDAARVSTQHGGHRGT